MFYVEHWLWRSAGSGRTMLFRLHEKGGKEHEVPAHHQAEIAMDAYLAAVFPEEKDKKAAIFQSIDRQGKLTGRRLEAATVGR